VWPDGFVNERNQGFIVTDIIRTGPVPPGSATVFPVPKPVIDIGPSEMKSIGCFVYLLSSAGGITSRTQFVRFNVTDSIGTVPTSQTGQTWNQIDANGTLGHFFCGFFDSVDPTLSNVEYVIGTGLRAAGWDEMVFVWGYVYGGGCADIDTEDRNRNLSGDPRIVPIQYRPTVTAATFLMGYCRLHAFWAGNVNPPASTFTVTDSDPVPASTHILRNVDEISAGLKFGFVQSRRNDLNNGNDINQALEPVGTADTEINFGQYGIYFNDNFPIDTSKDINFVQPSRNVLPGPQGVHQRYDPANSVNNGITLLAGGIIQMLYNATASGLYANFLMGYLSTGTYEYEIDVDIKSFSSAAAANFSLIGIGYAQSSGYYGANNLLRFDQPITTKIGPAKYIGRFNKTATAPLLLVGAFAGSFSGSTAVNMHITSLKVRKISRLLNQ